MAYEVPNTIKLNRGTVRKLKFELFDQNGGTPPNITSCTFKIHNTKTTQLISSGSVSVNNSDTDNIGNTVKTLQPTVNLDLTDVDVGMYQLSMKPVFATDESDVMRQPIEVVDYEVPT